MESVVPLVLVLAYNISELFDSLAVAITGRYKDSLLNFSLISVLMMDIGRKQVGDDTAGDTVGVGETNTVSMSKEHSLTGLRLTPLSGSCSSMLTE